MACVGLKSAGWLSWPPRMRAARDARQDSQSAHQPSSGCPDACSDWHCLDPPGYQLSSGEGTWCPHLQDRNELTVPHRPSREGPSSEIGDLKEGGESRRRGPRQQPSVLCVCIAGRSFKQPCAFVPKLLVQAPIYLRGLHAMLPGSSFPATLCPPHHPPWHLLNLCPPPRCCTPGMLLL